MSLLRSLMVRRNLWRSSPNHEDLREATKEFDDTVIVEGNELVTSSEYARELGERKKPI